MPLLTELKQDNQIFLLTCRPWGTEHRYAAADGA